MPKVNPNILSWAREKAGLTPKKAAKKLQIHDTKKLQAIEKLTALESGQVEPSRAMLVKMAKQYHRPLLTFYMSAPPKQGKRGHDFRTLPEGYSTVENAWVDALIRDVNARQSMVRAVLEDEDEADQLSFVGSMKLSSSIGGMLDAVQKTTQFDLKTYRVQKTQEAAFSYLRTCIESAGVFVLLIGNLGSHHSNLSVDLFRGFCIADDTAPFVIINDQDSKSAWSFTLLHELVHLFLGKSGISGSQSEQKTEKLCNDVASELLLPAKELQELEIDNSMDADILMKRIHNFAKDRNVSGSMVAYKLYVTGVINRDVWSALSKTFRDLWKKGKMDQRKKSQEQEGGPSYYTVARHKIGPALVHLVRRMLAGNVITTTKAGIVLGVKPKNVQGLITT